MIRDLILVFLGGGAGCVGRWGISVWLKRYVQEGQFPIHTFIANVVGCILIGLLMGYLVKHPNHTAQMMLATGFCGGFTTLSTFSLEGFELIKTGHTGMAALYVAATIVVGVGVVALGMWGARTL